MKFLNYVLRGQFVEPEDYFKKKDYSKKRLNVEKDDYRAMVKAAYSVFVPALLLIVGIFGAVIYVLVKILT